MSPGCWCCRFEGEKSINYHLQEFLRLLVRKESRLGKEMGAERVQNVLGFLESGMQCTCWLCRCPPPFLERVLKTHIGKMQATTIFGFECLRIWKTTG